MPNKLTNNITVGKDNTTKTKNKKPQQQLNKHYTHIYLSRNGKYNVYNENDSRHFTVFLFSRNKLKQKIKSLTFNLRNILR